jgi:hypothetical protein
MSFAKIKGKLSSRVGRRVNFGPPVDVKGKGGVAGAGTIIDEVWAYPDANEKPPHPQGCDVQCWGDYSFCSQLIKWDDGTHAIRLAYYRRRCGEDFWEFASQMTVCADPETIKVLFERTLARDTWFRTEPSAEQPKAEKVTTRAAAAATPSTSI